MFFNADNEEELSFEPLPQGFYLLTCVEAIHGPTKNGSGSLVTVKWNVENDSRTLIDRFNIQNQNPQAQKIGRAQLKKVCDLGGRPHLQSPDDLIGIQVHARVKHREYNGNIYAEVGGYVTKDHAIEQAKNFKPIPIATDNASQGKRVNQTMSAGFAQAPVSNNNQPANFQAPLKESEIPFGDNEGKANVEKAF